MKKQVSFGYKTCTEMILRTVSQGKAMKTIKSGRRDVSKVTRCSRVSVLGDNFVSEAADHEQPNYTGCMPGTRVGVLSRFMTWVKNDPMAIFWLAGMAGTGKTSIAVSLCRMLREDRAVFLGGGFFCSRSVGSAARTDVRRIIPTLAALIAGKSQEFADALASELEKDRHLGHKPVGEQIGPLLRSPLNALQVSTRPIVFVIDALDECKNELELAELLRLLVDYKWDAKIKFILTSRPELHIRDTAISNFAHNTILHLYTISADEVRSDIQLYIMGTLKAAIAEASWYSDHDVEQLVELSGGLFIFASTVLKYVLQRKGDEVRRDRLRKATSAVTAGISALTAVDKVYEFILVDATRSDIVDDDEMENMRNILACILTARTSLSVEALAVLVDMSPGMLRGSLEQLHSLIYVPTDDIQPGLQTLHASFGDYLFERGPAHIRITASLGHDLLAHGCLKRMAWDDLCFNVSRSHSSFKPNSMGAADGFPMSLIYACLNWPHHIVSASIGSAFDMEINRLFRPKLLFWLEVLSVLSKIDIASELLRIANSTVSQIIMSPLHCLTLEQLSESVISQFLCDAGVFVASSHRAISKSAPHIYLSALPFAAKESLVYRDFVPSCIGLVSVITSGTDSPGGQLVATLTGHEKVVHSVAYSPDGCLLASGSDDGSVRLWDVQTGAEVISPLQSDDGFVYCVAFSPNGRYVASATYLGSVHVWNVLTGRAALHPLHGHSMTVLSVTYSPDGSLIASSSGDHTVRIWSAENGLEIFVISGHTDRVNAVAFSPDGRLLASASHDKTIRLWDAQSSHAVGAPLLDLDDAVMCLCFSHDGKWLAASSMNTNVVRVWDPAIQQPTSVVISHGWSIEPGASQ